MPCGLGIVRHLRHRIQHAVLCCTGGHHRAAHHCRAVLERPHTDGGAEPHVERNHLATDRGGVVQANQVLDADNCCCCSAHRTASDAKYWTIHAQ